MLSQSEIAESCFKGAIDAYFCAMTARKHARAYLHGEERTRAFAYARAELRRARRLLEKMTPRPTSFREFCSKPAVGPTYTELAYEVDKLRRDAADSARYRADSDARTLRMGQQQGAAELATTLVEMLDGGATLKDVRDHLAHLLENDQ